MFVGHYSASFLAATDRRAPRLGVLFVAAQLVDIAFFLFVLAGIEHMRIVPGITVMNPMDLYDMPFTHSLLGALCWALAFGGVIGLVLRNRAAGVIAGLVVLSHWFLDLPVHRPDLTLAGHPPMLGFGLWDHPAIEMPLELGLAFASLAFFALRTTPDGAGGRWSLRLLALAMVILQAVNWLMPQPDQADTIVPASTPLLALLAYAILTALAWWTGSTRSLSTRARTTA